MASGNVPLSVYADRIARAQTEMRANGIEFMLVGPSSDLFYLFGFNAHLSERLNLLIIPATGKPTYVVPVLESFLVGDLQELATVSAWGETESPAERVAAVIGNAGGKQLAVADQLWSVFLIRLQSAI